MIEKPYRGIFVTGTDTGIGKTVVTAALAGALRQRGLSVGVMKPFQTGALETPEGLVAPDARFLTEITRVSDAPKLICPVLLRAPLAPSVAAELEGHGIDLQTVLAAYETLQSRYHWVIVEGAGGLAVPIIRNYDMRELAREMGLPLLIVARPSLGTINHTVLTIAYARAAGLPILGIIINNMPAEPNLAEQTSPNVIEDLTGVPILGFIHHDAQVDTELGNAGNIVAAMDQNPLLDRIIALMG